MSNYKSEIKLKYVQDSIASKYQEQELSTIDEFDHLVRTECSSNIEECTKNRHALAKQIDN